MHLMVTAVIAYVADARSAHELNDRRHVTQLVATQWLQAMRGAVFELGRNGLVFESVDAAFDGVAPFVDPLVERGSATTAAATVRAVADLVCCSGMVRRMPRCRS
jgi:hypothetical protein